MKDYIRQFLSGNANPLSGRNLVREYLQARVLESLQRSGAMIPLAFHGGTALRFLYAIPRYSEDLDFSLERPGTDYSFRAYLHAIQNDFTGEGYEVEVKLNESRPVNAAFIRFHHLLYEFGLSSQSGEVLAIKIEVDTNPPAGVGLDTTIVRRHVTLRLQHHDRASLLAGKLHAVFQRRYTKGRDLFDLMWYLSDPDWPNPNLTLLQNALNQTGWDGPALTENNWRDIVRARMEKLDWQRIAADVRPFLEHPGDLDLLTRESFEKVLGRSLD